ncbi:CDP-glycerol glycerophosphotransferase family protein [Natronococcus pandeyae]|uniref:CDP-glycerol glycerophosphotransferase family protein n=1 Tax=Natronococcus pandeyae TaxID=2055836 RepID=UPI0016531B6F|nr:CDP-glycerol glycerophosphotransferase family protein [Natronococcus pandeyae]
MVVPRTDTVWVFGADGGQRFVDNSKYLYLYANAHRGHLRAVWLSRNDDTVRRLQEMGYEAYRTDSLWGMWLNLRSQYAFVTHGMPDVNRWCSGGATTVVLWHGVALKRIGWDYDYSEFRGVLAKGKTIIKQNLIDRFDYVTVTSDAMIEPFSSAFRMDPNRILVTGYPRNDVLTESPAESDPGPNVEDDDDLRRRCVDETVLLYAPTKHWETDGNVVDQLELAELERQMTEIDAHLLFKPHPAEPFDLDGAERHRLSLVPEGTDIYPLLKHVDVLITDYSSIYFDYLLVDNPIVFYPFDLDEYRSHRGFYLDYESVTPGPIATTFDGLLQGIEEALDHDEFAEERRAVRETYLRPPNTGRCEAVCDLFDPAVERG